MAEDCTADENFKKTEKNEQNQTSGIISQRRIATFIIRVLAYHGSTATVNLLKQ
jgi:hypothetical protein